MKKKPFQISGLYPDELEKFRHHISQLPRVNGMKHTLSSWIVSAMYEKLTRETKPMPIIDLDKIPEDIKRWFRGLDDREQA